MKALISPAKSLELDREIPTSKISTPLFIKQAQKLNSSLAKLKKSEIGKLMSISDKLADLNFGRFKSFAPNHTTENSRQAIFTFNGDVYDGIDAYSINSSKFDYLQHTLRILSGLYGVLKPFDLMQAYRLEMGTKYQIDEANNLYEFWGDQITDALNDEISDGELVVNLASNEYFKAVNTKKLKGNLVSPVFKDYKNGKLKIISFYAKKARGSMYRYLLDNQIEDIDGLLNFDYDGYSFSEAETKKASSPVFIR